LQLHSRKDNSPATVEMGVKQKIAQQFRSQQETAKQLMPANADCVTQNF
jgi:hypothetical protein